MPPDAALTDKTPLPVESWFPEFTQQLVRDAYELIGETVKKWGHNTECDCQRCAWMRRACNGKEG